MQIRFIRMIDELFDGVPQTHETLELKEEMVQNLMEKYNDLLAEGKTEEEAFHIAAASIGDIDELLLEFSPRAPEPDDPFADDAQDTYDAPYEDAYTQGPFDAMLTRRHQSAMMVALSVMGYIACPAPIILFPNGFGLMLMFVMIAAATGLIIYNGMTGVKHGKNSHETGFRYDARGYALRRSQSAATTAAAVMLYILCPAPVVFFQSALGVSLLLVMVAAATGMLIYDGMTKPKKSERPDPDDVYQGDFADEYRQYTHRPKRKKTKEMKSIQSAISTLTLAAYFLVSFQTRAWHITWVIFLIGAAVGNIAKAFFDMKESG